MNSGGPAEGGNQWLPGRSEPVPVTSVVQPAGLRTCSWRAERQVLTITRGLLEGAPEALGPACGTGPHPPVPSPCVSPSDQRTDALPCCPLLGSHMVLSGPHMLNTEASQTVPGLPDFRALVAVTITSATGFLRFPLRGRQERASQPVPRPLLSGGQRSRTWFPHGRSREVPRCRKPPSVGPVSPGGGGRRGKASAGVFSPVPSPSPPWGCISWKSKPVLRPLAGAPERRLGRRKWL